MGSAARLYFPSYNDVFTLCLKNQPDGFVDDLKILRRAEPISVVIYMEVYDYFNIQRLGSLIIRDIPKTVVCGVHRFMCKYSFGRLGRSSAEFLIFSSTSGDD